METLIQMLDTLCPMHLVLDRTGHIAHTGPTLAKLRPDELLTGQRFLEVFELRRPRSVINIDDLRQHAGSRLHLRFRAGAQTGLKGVMMPAPGAAGHMVVNLSFGISVVDAVREFALTGGDFAATDLTIEMLYLVEAKSAAMEASRKLNQKLEGAKIAAEEQAFTDTLTGLKNRRAMDHVLSRAVAGPGRFALLHLDLDFFKAVNDTLGHAAGDHVLQEVARILVEETRDEDTVARVGGDEFMLLFAGRMNRKRLADICDRLIARLERPIAFGTDNCRISASIGITMSEDYETLDRALLQEDADIALYASKHRGRACHTFYDLSLRTAALATAPQAPGGNMTLR
ncbi:diguanylate cyclase domain-containing protein [Marinovum sp.]|uniref:diguanylate cyclase domain-containing protein n=1 Tax=Marinovum sp. TaxID=2024839 RepID=UPI002B2731FF|nr:diguanylate cyclase [Marinovum sp.]